MIKTIRNVWIVGTGSFAPEQVYTIEYLSTLVDSTPEWIYKTLGIKERHIAKASELTSDLAEMVPRQEDALPKIVKDVGSQ